MNIWHTWELQESIGIIFVLRRITGIKFMLYAISSDDYSPGDRTEPILGDSMDAFGTNP